MEETGGQFTGFEFKWGGGPARGAKAFQALSPRSTVRVGEPGDGWDFAGGAAEEPET